MRLKLFGFFGILYRQACQNCSLRAHKNNFKLLNFKEKFTIFGSFSEDEQKFFNFLANSVHKVGETACDASLAINWRFIFFFQKRWIFSFSVMEKNFSCLSIQLQQNCRKCFHLTQRTLWERSCSWILRVPGNILSHYSFIGKVFIFFSEFEKTSIFLPKCFQ